MTEVKETLADARKRWKYRRIMSFSAVAMSAVVIAYLAVFGNDTNAIQLMLAQNMPLTFAALVMAYIGGPIADDWLQLKVSRSA